MASAFARCLHTLVRAPEWSFQPTAICRRSSSGCRRGLRCGMRNGLEHWVQLRFTTDSRINIRQSQGMQKKQPLEFSMFSWHVHQIGNCHPSLKSPNIWGWERKESPIPNMSIHLKAINEPICLGEMFPQHGQGQECPLDGWERIARWQVTA